MIDGPTIAGDSGAFAGAPRGPYTIPAAAKAVQHLPAEDDYKWPDLAAERRKDLEAQQAGDPPHENIPSAVYPPGGVARRKFLSEPPARKAAARSLADAVFIATLLPNGREALDGNAAASGSCRSSPDNVCPRAAPGGGAPAISGAHHFQPAFAAPGRGSGG